MEDCFNDWIGASSCYRDIRDKLLKWDFRTVKYSLESLPHILNIATLSLFCRYCFSRCSSELVELFLLPYLSGRCTWFSNRLHDFSVTIPGCYKNVYISSFFHRTARLWNFLPAEVFPLTYDLNGSISTMPNIKFIFCWFLPLRVRTDATKF